ncbi:hypothetical protein LXL04_037902 [Taraxacum kok-saghyz]
MSELISESADHICKPLQQKRWTKRLQSARRKLRVPVYGGRKSKGKVGNTGLKSCVAVGGKSRAGVAVGVCDGDGRWRVEKGRRDDENDVGGEAAWGAVERRRAEEEEERWSAEPFFCLGLRLKV